MIQQTMDRVFNNNLFSPIFVQNHFVSEMKVFTDEFLPSFFNPLLLHPGVAEDGVVLT